MTSNVEEKKKKKNEEARLQWDTVAAGTCNQTDARFAGINQCVPMSTCAAIFSSILNRGNLTTSDIDTVLTSGDNLYLTLRIPGQVYESTYLYPEELPAEFVVGNYLVKIKPSHDSWLKNGLFPADVNDVDRAKAELELILREDVFNVDHDDIKHNYLIIGNEKCMSFWKHNDEYFYFNSHGVDETNTPNPRDDSLNLAHLYRCNSLSGLVALMFAEEKYGSQYTINRLELVSYTYRGNIATSSSSVVRVDTVPVRPNLYAISPLADFVDSSSSESSISFERESPQIVNLCLPSVELVMHLDSRSSGTSSDCDSSVTKSPKKKRGRPTKKKRGPKKATKDGDAHVKATKKYSLKHPEVNRESVRQYTQRHPEVHRDSVRSYTQSNPDVNREAVVRYNDTSRRNVARSLRSSTLLIGERHGDELDAVNVFYLAKHSLYDDGIHVCSHCGARLFVEERNRLKWCCGEGAYNVIDFVPLTESFYSHPSFIERPRAYNNLFAFSASGTTGGNPNPSTGIYFYKIQGRTYHRVFDLQYSASRNNIAMYINDDDERERIARGSALDSTVVTEIRHFLEDCNPYINCFRRLSRETSEEARLVFEPTTRRTHGNILGDMPIGREIAAIINTEREPYVPRSIVIWKTNDRPHTVDITHPLYESWQYPLLYPRGDPGWQPNRTDNKGSKLSQNKYYRWLLLAEDRFSKFGRLSEEWLVDMFSRMIEERLRFVLCMQQQQQNSNNNNSNSTALRTAPVAELQDETIQGEGDVVPGRIYLPNSFTGGPRYMKVKYMDAIALVRRLGPPTYFLTFTCNPQWPEIKLNQTADCRPCPQVCARVFNLKLGELLRDLRSGAWFGKCIYIMHVIEFQKRGLPHAHICFKVENGPQTNSTIDKFVRADIPSPSEAKGRLRKSVLDHMIHGPCGPPHRTDLVCWDNEKRKCLRFFPKIETPVTYHDDRGFVHLRRDSKNEGTIQYRGRDVTVNDLWVVPYNAALLLKYDCHINLEVASTRTVVKYLFKYMTKGPDESRVTVVHDRDGPVDEIEEYVTKRYVGSADAAWRVFEFDIVAREPNVKQLAVHLPERQNVFFRMSTDSASRSTDSDLITYFKRPMGDEFDNLTYLDFYERYIVHASRPRTKNVPAVQLTNSTKYITKRQRGELVTRLFFVAPNRGEQFFLRILLNSYPCRSFEDLYRLGGPDCSTFQEAAMHLGLADNQSEYEAALREAASFLTGRRLRSFFVLLAVNGIPVASLWETFKNDLSEDLIHKFPNEPIDRVHRECLILIDRLLRRHGTDLVEQGLPYTPDNTTELGRERTEHDGNRLKQFAEEWLPRLSVDQRSVFDYVDTLVNDDYARYLCNNAIFVDGPAGTGKTLLLQVIAAHVRSRGGIVLCTASSGIAAQNYEGGTTAHSMFKFPIDLVDDVSYWNITNGSQRGELVYHSDVIIYDEAPMAHKYLIHMLDRSLRDLMQSSKMFGGKVIIFAGDFRQIPPVVVNARCPNDVFNCSVKSSPLWKNLQTFALTTSQRCSDDADFANFLLDLGSDLIPTEPVQVGRHTQNLIDLSNISHVTELDELINFVFPHVVVDEPDVCVHRAILSTHNAGVRDINAAVLDKVPGESLHFKSVDFIERDNVDELFYGVDTLNSLQPKGIPEHDLVLKEGCVCMIIRNLSFADGLVNGTKVIVTRTSPLLITVRKAGQDESYFIPRILFKAPIERRSPVELCRRQFPLQVCYAMTVHKSQGQTIGRVGIDLRSDIFSHGQLYVALGRVRSVQHVRILIPRNRVVSGKPYANNVVYKRLLESS